LNIRPGTCVAIVGGSGAGKSTLIDLILGLIEPETGRILVDGEDIHNDVNAWWRRLRSIPQHIYLLDATLAENVAFGVAMERIDRDRVHEALKSAQLSDVVARLPEGIDQPIGENGVQLSGGERQRVGIARALYWDPEILVFDEATSALDAITEKRITDWLKHRRAGQTLLIVAHRLSTVQHADVIHLMDAGGIVASGSFRELLAQNPEFKALVAAARHHDNEGDAVFIDKDI
jgi:ABC-type multidrug transport system fused ATPase/permease subunit